MFFRSVKMEAAKAYVYFGVRENQGKIKRLKGPNQEFEVMWNLVQMFKITCEKIEEIWYKKRLYYVFSFQSTSVVEPEPEPEP
jgi:hypothetical protein